MKDGEQSLGAERVVFTMNATESLNIVLKGLLHPGDHVITTEMEHNSVLRPLYELEEKGIGVTIVFCEKNGTISCEKIKQAIGKNTKAIVCTHASNVTGDGNDIAQIGTLCEKYNLYFILDASQTAGTIEIDMEQNHISAICFTGHKGLFGPQGTGGIALADGVCVKPLLSGGSGVHSFERKHPMELPAALEAGTLNGHGIAGLHAALDWIKKTGIAAIHEKEMALNSFSEELKQFRAFTSTEEKNGWQRSYRVIWRILIPLMSVTVLQKIMGLRQGRGRIAHLRYTLILAQKNRAWYDLVSPVLIRQKRWRKQSGRCRILQRKTVEK